MNNFILFHRKYKFLWDESLYLCESYQTAMATGQIDNTLSQNNSLCDDYIDWFQN